MAHVSEECVHIDDMELAKFFHDLFPGPSVRGVPDPRSWSGESQDGHQQADVIGCETETELWDEVIKSESISIKG